MPSILADVERCVTKRLMERKADAREALDIGSLVAADLRREWGGDRPYIALGFRQRTEERRARIRAEYNGRNMKEVMAHYGVARQTVYDALRPRNKKRAR